MIKRIWAGHRVATIAVGVIAVVALLAASLLVVVNAGKTATATATHGATPSGTAFASPSPSDSATPSPTPFGPPTPIPAGWVYSDLDGLPAPPELAHRLPLAVMVADNAASRPQSGISTASIVYQAYADGGEDRYMMIWQEGTATDIGPVRSARPYYVYWAAEYKALYTHVGGDAHSLKSVIPAMAKYIYNMDELSSASCAFHRITTRPAPQNDYTNSADLIMCAAKKGYPATLQNLPTRTFRTDTPYAELPASQTVSIPYRTHSLGIVYTYHPATNSYLRSVEGQPEIDPANGNQVFARNVVVMYQSVGTDANSMDEVNRPWVFNTGSGKCTVYQEGKVIQGTWKKSTNYNMTLCFDSSGKEIPLVRGQIFIQSIPPGTAVTVS
jgi:Protein of unknown function (DUF3048) N-terminal domain/Protein of unknown function (DUF3048) C-terminal domain